MKLFKVMLGLWGPSPTRLPTCTSTCLSTWQYLNWTTCHSFHRCPEYLRSTRNIISEPFRATKWTTSSWQSQIFFDMQDDDYLTLGWLMRFFPSLHLRQWTVTSSLIPSIGWSDDMLCYNAPSDTATSHCEIMMIAMSLICVIIIVTLS